MGERASEEPQRCDECESRLTGVFDQCSRGRDLWLHKFIGCVEKAESRIPSISSGQTGLTAVNRLTAVKVYSGQNGLTAVNSF